MVNLSQWARERYSAEHWSMVLDTARLRKAYRLLSRLQPGRLLDVGCGDGAFAAQFTAQWEVYGVDLSEDNVRRALARGVAAVACDLQEGSLPFPDGSFDAAFAGEIIEHIFDTDRFLQELHRVLRPGGVLLITTPNLASLENRIALALGIKPRWVEYRALPGQGSGHIRFYTTRVLVRQLQERGFTVERVIGDHLPLALHKLGLSEERSRLLSWLGDLFPGLAMCALVLCRRPPASAPLGRNNRLSVE